MTQYLSYITWHYTKKNKLDIDVSEFLETINRRVIEERDIEIVKQFILDQITRLESENPRCKSLNAEWRETNEDGDFKLDNVNCLNFRIYKSRNNFLL